MHVLILGYEYPPIGGGTGQALHHLLLHWPREGDWDLEVWTASPPTGIERDFPEGIRFREFSCGKADLHFWKTREQFLLLWKTWRMTLGDNPFPDAILVWGGWPLGLLLLGAFGQVPSVLALRGSDVPGFNTRTSGWVWKLLARLVWGRSRVLTANSPSLAALAKRTWTRKRIAIIPNGVTAPASAGTPKLGVEEPIEARPWQILSVNRLVPRKRVDWLIQALSHLPADLRDQLRVKIAGEGPERYRLETMARELDVHRFVHFLGEVPPDGMAALYGESDLFVLASEAEGLSNALLEAMSQGLPALLSTPTGFADIDEAAVIVDRPQKLAQHIRLLLLDPDRRQQRSLGSREVAARYTWQRVAEEYAQKLEEAVRKAGLD